MASTPYRIIMHKGWQNYCPRLVSVLPLERMCLDPDQCLRRCSISRAGAGASRTCTSATRAAGDLVIKPPNLAKEGYDA